MGGYVGTAKQPIALFDAYTKGQADGLFPDKTSATPQDFTAMPSVGGDPVVESGSNADGEWTRWADGTQVCLGLNIALSSSSDVTWTYPMIFIQFPNISGGVIPASRVLTTGATAPSTSSATLQAWLISATPSRSSAVSSPVAIGRWK